MSFPFNKSQPEQAPAPLFSPDATEILRQIRAGWRQSGQPSPEDCEIVAIALEHLRRELGSRSANEVIEEVHREILYRQWCAANCGDSV